MRGLLPELSLWGSGPCKCDLERLPIDVIAGGSAPRRWLDDPSAGSWDRLEAEVGAAEAGLADGDGMLCGFLPLPSRVGAGRSGPGRRRWPPPRY